MGILTHLTQGPGVLGDHLNFTMCIAEGDHGGNLKNQQGADPSLPHWLEQSLAAAWGENTGKSVLWVDCRWGRHWLVEQGMYGDQDNSHSKWPDHTMFLILLFTTLAFIIHLTHNLVYLSHIKKHLKIYEVLACQKLLLSNLKLCTSLIFFNPFMNLFHQNLEILFIILWQNFIEKLRK